MWLDIRRRIQPEPDPELGSVMGLMAAPLLCMVHGDDVHEVA